RSPVGRGPSRGLPAHAPRGIRVGGAGMRRAALLAIACTALAALAAGDASIPPFSTAEPGAALPAGWFPIALPYGKHSEIGVVREEGGNALRVRSIHAFGSVAHRMSVDPAAVPRLSWRWKVDRVVEGARLERKGKEDFAARVYVSFEYPEEMLSFGTRAKLAIARTFFDFVPSAALCYVWDNRHAIGTGASWCWRAAMRRPGSGSARRATSRRTSAPPFRRGKGRCRA